LELLRSWHISTLGLDFGLVRCSMKTIALVVLEIFALASLAAVAGDPQSATPSPTPVLVELFTSEGCSSCPPADSFLQQLDAQPVPGTQLIVLSEHVDYWNHIGWTDPYSSAVYSERQNAYANHFRLDSVYTPQMIVDGKDEFVGNSPGEARKSIDRAATVQKIPVRISGATLSNGLVQAHVETGTFSAHEGKADVYFLVALNYAETQVARGENAGHHLTHVAVVRNLVKVGKVEPGKAFSQDISLKLPKGTEPAMLRVIAFVQEPGPGRVLGAALEKLTK
jgi:hypothetical protein